MLAEAQQLLWAACHAYDEEQAASDMATRRLVCQRYRPTDIAQLQQQADNYGDGERVPAQQVLVYEQEFVQLRGRAQALVSQLLQDKAVTKAAGQLHQLKHLLLEARLPPDAEAAWRQLLMRVAEALLDGSSPPAAVPLLVALLQQGLRRQAPGQHISEQEQARLVPMICRGLAPGARIQLRQHEGAGLLRSLITPDALLDQGRLLPFYTALKMVVDTCCSARVPADATGALLAAFDATRFAVLVCEEAKAPALHSTSYEEGGSSGGGDGGSPPQRVSMQNLLELAHASLAQPGAGGTGMAVLEGVLTLQPASFLAAALQLALAGGGGQERSSVLGMLCRVPTDLLPPPVLADALIQLTEAVDGNQLAPPFLPYDLISRLYCSQHVMDSMRAAVERGPEAAAALAAATAGRGAAPELWTVRISGTVDTGGEGSGGSGGTASADAATIAARAASGSSSMQQPTAEGLGQRQGAAGPAARSSLLLLPLQASSEPLVALLQKLVGAVLSSLLRRAGASLDAASLSEELLQLLEVLLMPAAQQGAWMLQWLWGHLYQEALHPFLMDAAAAVDSSGGGGGSSSGPVVAAFQSYWASLPWHMASFHAASPAALSALRLHLVAAAGDGAAAVLLRELDFAPVLAKAAPAFQATCRVDQVYSLDDDEAEEEATAAGEAQDRHGRAAWAAELGLLALHACVLLPAQEQPGWLQQLLHGVLLEQAQQQLAPAQQAGGVEEEGAAADVHAIMRSPLSAALLPLAAAAGQQQPLLPHLLAAGDWRRLAGAMRAEEAAADAAAAAATPWLLLPLLLSPASVAGDVGGRVVHAAGLLSRAAVLSALPEAAEAAAAAVSPLLLCSLCQGAKQQPEQRRPQQLQGAQQVAAAAAGVPGGDEQQQQEQVVIPEGFPLELLADTVEGQQLLLLQQQQREQQEAAQQAGLQAQVAAAAAAADGNSTQQQHGAPEQQQLLVEVRGCWSLTVDQHLLLLQQSLLPLAASQASLALAASWQADQCPAELATAGLQDASSALHEWRPPRLAKLMQAASMAEEAATAAPEAGQPGSGGSSSSSSPAAAAAAAAAGVGTLLMPLARQPITVLTADPLPFNNSELPLDTQAALFVSTAPEGSSSGGPAGADHHYQQQQHAPLQGLRQTLGALLPGTEARQRAQQAGQAGGSMDAHFIKAQLLYAVQAACKQAGAASLTACLLRLLYACPALHACPEALELAESLLRFLAAPEQDGGPLGQAAAGSSLMLPSAASAPFGAPAGASGRVLGSAHSATGELATLEVASADDQLQSSAAAGQVGVAVADAGLAAATDSGEAGSASGAPAAGFPPADAVQLAVTAAQGLPAAILLGLARGAAQLHAPLTAALALERLRQSTTVLPKDEWAALVTQVLHVAVQANAEPVHPFDPVAVWLAALAWVSDSRWRRLSNAGPHHAALLDWLEALDLRVVALRLAVPEDFSMDSPGGSPSRLLSTATDRLKSIRQHIPGLKPSPAHAAAGAAAGGGGGGAAGFVAPGTHEFVGEAPPVDGRPQLGQKMKQGFRSLIAKAQGEAPGREAATGGGDATAGGGGSVPGQAGLGGQGGTPEKKGPLAGLRSRLAKMRIGEPAGEAAGPEAAPAGTMLPHTAGGSKASHGLGTVAEEAAGTAGGELAATAGPATGHLGATSSGSGGTPAGGGSGAAVRQKISSGLQAVGRGLGRVRTKLADRQVAHDELADYDQDVAIRVGLAAFAVSAYIKSVLCPSLTPRVGSGGDSAGPGTPTWRSLADGGGGQAGAVGRVYHHRQSSSLGSMRVDELYLRELDRVLEARSELDSLEALAACPLLAAAATGHPSIYQQFLQDVPLLLAAAPNVASFQRSLQRLLFEAERQLLAVL